MASCPCEWSKSHQPKKRAVKTHQKYVEQPSHTHAAAPAWQHRSDAQHAICDGGNGTKNHDLHAIKAACRLESYTSAGKNATNKWGTLTGIPIEMRSIIGRIHTSNNNVLKDSLVTIEHLTHLLEPVSRYLRKCTCMCLSVYVISATSDFLNISTLGFRSLLETQAWSM